MGRHPGFHFYLSFSALVWAFVQIKGVPFENLPHISLISVIASRVFWKLIQPDFFSFKLPNEDDVKVTEIFKKNVVTDTVFDLGLSFLGVWCAYLSQNVNKSVIVYFSISIAINVIAIFILGYVQADAKKNGVEQLQKLTDASIKKILWIYIFVGITFVIFESYVCIEVVQSMRSDLASIKGLLIYVGSLLLIKFYTKGRYWFTALEVKRDELTNLIRNLSRNE